MGLFTKDVFLEGEGEGVKKFVVCMGEEKTNEEIQDVFCEQPLSK
jgi:hypothetical protein